MGRGRGDRGPSRPGPVVPTRPEVRVFVDGGCGSFPRRAGHPPPRRVEAAEEKPPDPTAGAEDDVDGVETRDVDVRPGVDLVEGVVRGAPRECRDEHEGVRPVEPDVEVVGPAPLSPAQTATGGTSASAAAAPGGGGRGGRPEW